MKRLGRRRTLSVAAAGMIAAATAWALVPSPSLGAEPAARHRDFLRARAEAVAWLDRLEVDPVALLERGIKGKKKLAEILDIYVLLQRYSSAGESPAFAARIASLAAHTDRAEYHNMRSCSDSEFKHNSMSYLRVLWLMQGAGLDTGRYLEEVRRAKRRLDRHLGSRGLWQRRMFAAYYDRFGLDKPPILTRAERGEDGVLMARPSADALDLGQSYQLTHEVFVAYDYGLERGAERLAGPARRYLREVLPALLEKHLVTRNADIVGEVLSAMSYVGLGAHPAYVKGVDFLLESQNEDGTWGRYEAARRQYGDLVDQHLYLHTTGAALRALLEAFADSSPETPGAS